MTIAKYVLSGSLSVAPVTELKKSRYVLSNSLSVASRIEFNLTIARYVLSGSLSVAPVTELKVTIAVRPVWQSVSVRLPPPPLQSVPTTYSTQSYHCKIRRSSLSVCRQIPPPSPHPPATHSTQAKIHLLWQSARFPVQNSK